MAELKRMAAQRAMIYVSEMIDQKIMPRIGGQKDGEKKRKSEDES